MYVPCDSTVNRMKYDGTHEEGGCSNIVCVGRPTYCAVRNLLKFAIIAELLAPRRRLNTFSRTLC
jgi:hypothetical protein